MAVVVATAATSARNSVMLLFLSKVAAMLALSVALSFHLQLRAEMGQKHLSETGMPQLK